MSRDQSSSLPAKAAARLLRSRRLMRAPIWIYKARAGALFGSRILMLEHVGRKSGTPRYAVLEVTDHPSPDTYVVASGFGRKAQWFRNIQANPRVRVYAGSHAPRRAAAPSSTKTRPTARWPPTEPVTPKRGSGCARCSRTRSARRSPTRIRHCRWSS